MAKLQEIRFYDILGNCAKDRAWSPNTWKTRYALNFKGLPYKTIWLEYPDIERTCKEVGAEPTWKPSAGDPTPPYYSCPFIFDPNTNTAVSDSAVIARYLDKTYPDTPVLIPPEIDALYAAFEDAARTAVWMPLLPLLLPASHPQLNTQSQDHYKRQREAQFSQLLGGRLEEWTSPGPMREKQWEAVRAGLSKVSGWMTADQREKPFFMGERVCYADFFVAAALVWLKRVFGSESLEWAELESWDNGRWGRFMDYMQKYEVVV